MDINDDLILKRNDTVIERFGEDLLLFDSSSGKLFEVNETGKSIWTMINGEHCLREIREKLEVDFEESQKAEKDLIEFIKKLNELNLIHNIE